jgi:uncharacterized protein YjiS (DUF1127 family)
MNTSRRAEAASHIFDVKTIIRGLGSKFGQHAQRVQASIQIRRDRARLHAMPDHMLKDIGISRCEISYSTRVSKAKSAGWLRRSGE